LNGGMSVIDRSDEPLLRLIPANDISCTSLARCGWRL
jgi:hypothetical protein